VVERIVAEANQVQVVIKNQGDATVQPAGEFWVDLYINPNPVPTSVNRTWPYVAGQGAAWGIIWSGSPYTPADPRCRPGRNLRCPCLGRRKIGLWQPSPGVEQARPSWRSARARRRQTGEWIGSGSEESGRQCSPGRRAIDSRLKSV
jgi:hypothetical protein